jgi:hypothetical protein
LTNLTLDELLGETADDEARQIANDLASQNRLALLPFRSKSGLVSAMLDGFSDDDDEQAIFHVFTHTKQQSPAEAAQLLAAATWEALSFSFDGQEYDDLEKLFSSW